MTHLQLQGLRALVRDKAPPAGSRTWGENRCAHCCNGDRCDDPTHYDRSGCPYCLSTGYALWLPEFQPLTPPTTEGSIAAKCQRIEGSGEICGLTPPCPDCGSSLIDVPEGAF